MRHRVGKSQTDGVFGPCLQKEKDQKEGGRNQDERRECISGNADSKAKWEAGNCVNGLELPPPPMELTLRASTKIKTMISASQRQLEEEMDESVEFTCAYSL